ncbi:MAG: hypothetical protein IKJ18_05265 [Bacteroidaceae bacterium]|nr:hypothetical protein [Bacteroidaceae bacterium]
MCIHPYKDICTSDIHIRQMLQNKLTG